MNTKFLEYELALLLAKYGRRAVLAGLSQKLDLSPEQLDVALRAFDNQHPESRRSGRTDHADLIDVLIAEMPNKAEQLRTLNHRFQAKQFLPHLRDVRRFLERHSENVSPLKSRAESYPRLMRLLADIDESELSILCESAGTDEYSSLGVLSDEILRRDRVHNSAASNPVS